MHLTSIESYLSIHVTFTAIVPGAYPGEAKMCLTGWLQKLTHVPLAIAIFLVVTWALLYTHYTSYPSVLYHCVRRLGLCIGLGHISTFHIWRCNVPWFVQLVTHNTRVVPQFPFNSISTFRISNTSLSNVCFTVPKATTLSLSLSHTHTHTMSSHNTSISMLSFTSHDQSAPYEDSILTNHI